MVAAEALIHSREGNSKIRTHPMLTASGPSFLVIFDSELRGAENPVERKLDLFAGVVAVGAPKNPQPRAQKQRDSRARGDSEEHTLEQAHDPLRLVRTIAHEVMNQDVAIGYRHGRPVRLETAASI